MSEWGIVSNQLLLLDSNIVMNNVVGSTGVDMLELDVTMHETVRNCV